MLMLDENEELVSWLCMLIVTLEFTNRHWLLKCDVLLLFLWLNLLFDVVDERYILVVGGGKYISIFALAAMQTDRTCRF